MKNRIWKNVSVLCCCAILFSGCGQMKIIRNTTGKTDVSGVQTEIRYSYDDSEKSGGNSSPSVPEVEVSPSAKYFLVSLDKDIQNVYKQIYAGLLEFSESIDVTDNVIRKEDIGKLLELCISSSPEISYVGQNYTVCINDKDYVTDVNVTYRKTPAQADSENKALQKKAEVILDGVKKNWGDYEIVKYFHDTIIQNCEYSEDGKDPYSAYGCLYDGKAVCEGYSKAMQYLCGKVGINCIPVTGQGNSDDDLQSHIWNKIEIDGKWYCFDLTWDDPVSDFEDGYVRYDYFGITDEEINRDHITEDNPYMKYPEAVSKDNDYFVRNGIFCTGDSDYMGIIEDSVFDTMMNNEQYARIKCDGKELYDRILDEVFSHGESNSSKIFDIISECVDKGNTSYSKDRYSLIKDDTLFTITVKLVKSD